MIKHSAFFSAAFLAFAASADSARFLSEKAGSTVDAAADYLLPANWENGTVGNASGRDVSFSSHTTAGFVSLADDVTVAGFSGFRGLVMTGDGKIAVSKGNAPYSKLQNTCFYTDIEVPSGVNAETYDVVDICADVKVDGYIRFLAFMKFRADLYAKSSSAERDTPWDSGDLNMSGNYIWFYAPRGSDGVTGTWNQTEGSAYLFPVSVEKTPAAGATVTGEGIPDGTFLKRIFPDGSIELSSPVTATLSGNAVEFSAFDPDFTQTFKYWRSSGSNSRIALVKYRSEDKARLVFSTYSGSDLPRGITMPDGTDDLFPGTVVLSNACNLTVGELCLGRCRVELPGTELAGGAGLPNVPAVRHYDSSAESTFVVPGGVTAVVNNFTNLVGTLAKEGAGALSLVLENEPESNTGVLAVKEGRVDIVSSAGNARVREVTVADGAVLSIPEGVVFRCDEITGNGNAMVTGPGKLVVSGLPRELEGIAFSGGATVEFAGVRRDGFVYELPEAAVAGNPALWLDISSGVETDESGEHVLRWNDVRGEGYMFVTNRNAKLKPQLVRNAAGAAVSVFLPADETSAAADDQAILMWSEPLSRIRAVFIVKGAYKGGGQLLGGITDMTWMRQQNVTSFNGPLFYQGTSSASPALANGRFFVNGELRSVDNGYAYPGGVTNSTALADWRPQLAEFITAGDTYADNFAYNRSGAGRSGRQLIHAAVIYTNELTEVQRLATERYLLKRFGLVDVQVVDPESLPGAVGTLSLGGGTTALPVADGGAATVDAVSGFGTLEKKGAGLVLVKDLHAEETDVVVSGGDLVVRSFANDAGDLPGNPAIHVDASAASTITTNASGKVTKWTDVRGEEVNVATNIPGCWGASTVVQDAVGGLPAVSFGAYGVYGTLVSSSPALRFNNLKANAFFNVMSSVNGGGVLLGCCDDKLYSEDGQFYGIRRQAYDSMKSYAYNAIYRRPSWEVRDYDHALICNGPGATLFRQDGVEKDISNAMPSDGYQLIACAMPEPINTSGFAQIKNSSTGNGYGYGGMALAESIIYTNTLSRGAVLQVEAYLNRKWFGAQTPGYRPAKARSLKVASGATVTVQGGAPFSVGTFASGGSVAGDVTVAEGGTLEIAVAEDGSVVPLGVSGRLTLVGGGTVLLTGAASEIRDGLWPLAGDVSVSGSWSVENADGSRQRKVVRLFESDGGLYLRVDSSGFKLIVR